jgi:hypothetical protein
MSSRASLAVCFLITLFCSSVVRAQQTSPIYMWFEPEWFPGVKGDFSYWTGKAKPIGTWGIAGPGITAEWSQGGESEWNSMGACAEETHASCERAIVVPRVGKYRLWVRYVDHRNNTEPFTARVEQSGKAPIAGELGVQGIVPPNDEYMLYWDFAFGWAKLEGELAAGPATIKLTIDKPGQAWRQVDAILLTDDETYTPVAREKPRFAYVDAFKLEPGAGVGAAWRGSGEAMSGAGTSVKRPQLAGRDFTMWTRIGEDKKWWDAQNVDSLSFYDVMFEYGCPTDIKKEFQKQFAGRRDLPLISWPNLTPDLYLATPDLSPGTPMRKWLERTKTPFAIITNYANPKYDDKTGPATFQALSGPLAAQFLGFVHGEAVGTVGVPRAPRSGQTRRQHIDTLAEFYNKTQTEQWSQIFHAQVPPTFRAKSIACLSVDSISLAHAFANAGHELVAYELDATNAHTPMRTAFMRGAARQFGKGWINYASGNFGDACDYFTQDPIVPRGAKGWWHSKYAVTDGVPVAWYRDFYFLNYLSGACAMHWEQGQTNQWMMPGPGEHPVMLSPFGRATQAFQAFVDRVGDRGEPYTPVALLLSYGHGYERVNNACKMLDYFVEDANDREIDAVFNVAWHPSERLANEPITPMRQSLPGGAFGNIFDVLVDRTEKLSAINDYPVVWCAGDVELGGPNTAVLQDYVNRGGTLVVNVEAVRGKLPEAMLGVKLSGQRKTFDRWTPFGAATQTSTPYEVEIAQSTGATALAWSGDQTVPLMTRNAVGKGAIILTLVPHATGIDERPHPALPWLMSGLTQDLLPIDVRIGAKRARPTSGDVMYQINWTKDGWLVMLLNNAGVDKTQTGIARVNRLAGHDVHIRTRVKLAAGTATELTQQQELPVVATNDSRPESTFNGSEINVGVTPGDVQVVKLTLK